MSGDLRQKRPTPKNSEEGEAEEKDTKLSLIGRYPPATP